MLVILVPRKSRGDTGKASPNDRHRPAQTPPRSISTVLPRTVVYSQTGKKKKKKNRKLCLNKFQVFVNRKPEEYRTLPFGIVLQNHNMNVYFLG